jgi:hypothetical protein
MKITTTDDGQILLLTDHLPAELILSKPARAHCVIISGSVIVVLLYKELTMNVYNRSTKKIMSESLRYDVLYNNGFVPANVSEHIQFWIRNHDKRILKIYELQIGVVHSTPGVHQPGEAVNLM